MTELDFRIVDTDNHFYETTDAFTRHMDPKMAPRAIQWADVDGQQRLLVGGKVNHFFASPTCDPIWKPGSLREMLRKSDAENRSPDPSSPRCEAELMRPRGRAPAAFGSRRRARNRRPPRRSSRRCPKPLRRRRRPRWR